MDAYRFYDSHLLANDMFGQQEENVRREISQRFVRYYGCGQCSETFYTLEEVLDHWNSYLSYDYSFTCPHCHNNKDSLQRARQHLDEKHGINWMIEDVWINTNCCVKGYEEHINGVACKCHGNMPQHHRAQEFKEHLEIGKHFEAYYVCKVCTFHYGVKPPFSRNFCTPGEQQVFQCHQCNLTFPSLHEKSRHRHTTRNPDAEADTRGENSEFAARLNEHHTMSSQYNPPFFEESFSHEERADEMDVDDLSRRAAHNV